MVIGEFTIKAMPSTPMTDAEMYAQLDIVSECAEALDYFTEDELEQSADNQKRIIEQRRILCNKSA